MKILQLTLPLTILPILLTQLLLLQSPTISNVVTQQTTVVDYITTTNLFPNPERGLYHLTEAHSNNYFPLDLATLQGYRQNENITLILRTFYLEDFVNSEISKTYLNAMQEDFETIRRAGLKVIVRFAYTNQLHFASGTTWPPIPPYGDATKEQVLAHIEQLQPILQANRDVIAVVQLGFIGIWGEWFFTDHFVSDPWEPWEITAADFISRGYVLTSTLAVLPSNRMVQVRKPLYKQQIYDPQFPRVYTTGVGEMWALDPSDAHTGSDIARTGHYNDCFLASDTDIGTYADITEDKAYLAKETLYLPMGGETCLPNPPRSDCPTALEELERFHWSYLHIDYHPTVIDGWDSEGCLNEVERRLGYRFALVQGVYADRVKPGDAFSVEIQLRNVGWAAPFNPRLIELLLRHKASGELYYVALPDDPRFWLADNSATYSLKHAICTPADLPIGDYELLLNLPDPEWSLYWQKAYAIRLANEMVWEEDTGYNSLLHTITVSETATSPVCNSDLILESRGKVFLPVILKL